MAARKRISLYLIPDEIETVVEVGTLLDMAVLRQDVCKAGN